MVWYCASAICDSGHVMYGDGPTCVSAEIDACNQCVDYGGVSVSKDCWVCG